MPRKVNPLGEIKSKQGVKFIEFSDACGDTVLLRESFGTGRDVVVVTGSDGAIFSRSQVESLVAHLEAWLATGSFEIKEAP